jgi:hypothetical protein
MNDDVKLDNKEGLESGFELSLADNNESKLKSRIRSRDAKKQGGSVTTSVMRQSTKQNTHTRNTHTTQFFFYFFMYDEAPN